MFTPTTLIKGIFSGLGAGFMATLPMTVWMLCANKTIPAHQPDPLPPEEITRNLTETVALEPHLDETDQKKLSLFNHFVYGAIIAIPMSFLNRNHRAGLAIRRGIGYGLLVWVSNYLGLLPTLRLYPSATQEPARMNFIMIIGHILWGGLSGLISNRLYRSVPSRV